MRKLGRFLLLAALVAGLLIAWRARRSVLRPAASVPAASAAARRTAPPRRAHGHIAAGHPAVEGPEAAGAVLAGRVVRADTGEPVPGATVVAESERSLERTSLTDGAGRFRLEGLSAGRYRSRAHAEGLFGQMLGSVWLDDGETGASITIAVHPAASLRGRIELAATAAPCPGGEVLLEAAVIARVTAIADDAGDVLFPALLPGRYDVRLTCAGHATREAAPPIEVGAAALVVRFAVHEQLAIMGTLVDEKGTPDALGATIVASPRKVEPDGFGTSTNSGDDGRFDLRPVKAGTYEVSALSPGGTASLRPVVVTVAEGVPTPEVRLVTGARHHLEGHVLDDQGRPLEGAAVDAHQEVSGGWCAVLRDDGHFELDDLLPGVLRLSVAIGETKLPVLSGEVEPVVPAAGPITLIVKGFGGNIDGRVLGERPAHERFTVNVSGPLGREVTTDDDGRFSVSVQPDAEYALYVTTDRGETAVAERVKAGAHVDMRLRRAGTLRGTVHGAPRVFRVSLRSDSFGEVFFATDGMWEMRNVPAGQNTVEVRAQGLVATQDFTLAPGETRTLDLQLAPPQEEHEGDTTEGNTRPASAD
jgi:hypothetical protein